MTTEKTTARDNWGEILDLIEGLWPTRARKEMSPELVTLWRDRLGTYEKLTVMGALKDHAANITFFPKLGQIANSCKSRISSSYQNVDQLRDKMEEYKKERDESMKEMDLILTGLGEEELDAHKEAELEDKPLLAWMKDQNSNTLTWRMLIAQRIKKGDKPKIESELPDI